jgi:hypothetical protein
MTFTLTQLIIACVATSVCTVVALGLICIFFIGADDRHDCTDRKPRRPF